MSNILRSGGRRGHQSESSLSKLTRLSVRGRGGGRRGEGGGEAQPGEEQRRRKDLDQKLRFFFFFFLSLVFFPCEVGERNELWNCDFFSFFCTL